MERKKLSLLLSLMLICSVTVTVQAQQQDLLERKQAVDNGLLTVKQNTENLSSPIKSVRVTSLENIIIMSVSRGEGSLYRDAVPAIIATCEQHEDLCLLSKAALSAVGSRKARMYLTSTGTDSRRQVAQLIDSVLRQHYAGERLATVRNP